MKSSTSVRSVCIGMKTSLQRVSHAMCFKEHVETANVMISILDPQQNLASFEKQNTFSVKTRDSLNNYNSEEIKSYCPWKS